MINRGVIIGFGTVLLVVGLAGLGLLQTGVMYPPGSSESVKLAELGPGQQSGGNPLAGVAESTSPTPQSGSVSPGGRVNKADQAASLAGGPSAEKPVPIPQVGQGERRYPGQQPGATVPGFAQTRPPYSDGASAARKPGFDENRLRARLKSESKHHASYARKAAPTRSSKPVVIRFDFDPAQYRRLDVAQVHLGDKIRVKVRRVGPVDRRVYFTFSRSLDSPQGAILELGTMYSFERVVFRPRDRGHYKIEVKIYPGNRWNIAPRSFV